MQPGTMQPFNYEDVKRSCVEGFAKRLAKLPPESIKREFFMNLSRYSPFL